MKKKLSLFLIFFASLQANILLEPPKLVSQDQLHNLIISWHANFTWSWTWGSFSFMYKESKPGFVIKVLGIPFLWKNHRLLPNLQELACVFSSSSYYFDTPLEYQDACPRKITRDELFALIAHKTCVFYTGAGLSAASHVPTMNELMSLLKLDNGGWEFIKAVSNSPEELGVALSKFCTAMMYAEPTRAHYALKQIAQENHMAIITENLDLLQQRTGIEPLFAFSDVLKAVTEDDWRQVGAIICVGLSHDDRGLLARYKRHNPEGKIIAVDLKTPHYLSSDDYFCMGDLQDIIAF